MSNILIQDVVNKLKESITVSLDNDQTFKVILSKPRSKEYQKGICTPYKSKAGIKLKIVLSTKTQDFTSNIEIESLNITFLDLLADGFLFLDFVSADENFYVKQSKKGAVTIGSSKANLKQKPIDDHNREKHYLIPTGLQYLFLLGITNKDGKVLSHSQKKYRQINKFIEIIDRLVNDNEINNIVDMGCGKGYLTFSMYAFLRQKYPDRNITITGYDIRPELMDLCNKIAEDCEYTGLKFVVGNIGEIETPSVDLLVALHACDIATDMAIYQGIKSKVEFMVLSPCCHKQIRKEITKTTAITQYGIFLERQAEMVTDTIRALLLESQGYTSSIFEFISSEHTAKNTMITAQKHVLNNGALSEIKKLKASFGIEEHYLEKLLAI